MWGTGSRDRRAGPVRDCHNGCPRRRVALRPLTPTIAPAPTGAARTYRRGCTNSRSSGHPVSAPAGAHDVTVASVDGKPAAWTGRSPIRAAGRWLAVPALLGFAWLAGGLSSFTWPAAVTTFAVAGAVLGYAAVRRRDRAPVHLGRTGFVVWVTWLAAVTGWELWALFSLPRSTHPTISSLVDELISSHPARAGAVLLWVLIGWWLARR